MTHHVPWEQLVDWAEGQLPNPDTAALQRHLESCADCAADARWLQATLQQMGANPLVAPPKRARAAVEAAFEQRFAALPTLQQAPPARRARRTFLSGLQWGLAAAAALLLVMILLRSGQNRTVIAAVQDVSGSAHVQQGESQRDLRGGEGLVVGDVVGTEEGGEATLSFAGGEITVTLYSHSYVAIKEVEEEQSTLQRLALYTDYAGEMLIEAQGPGEVQLQTPPGLLSTVEGTFFVRYLPGTEDIGLEVRKGTVTCRNSYGARKFTQGESTILYEGVAPGEVRPATSATPTSTPPSGASPSSGGESSDSPATYAVPINSGSGSDHSGEGYDSGSGGDDSDSSGNPGSGSDKSGDDDSGSRSDDSGGANNSGSGSDNSGSGTSGWED